jgi:hypothetical protein
VIANPTTTTTYSISIPLSGCPNSGQIIVNVNPLNFIGISRSQYVCIGDSILLIATGGENYSWSPASGLSATTGDTVLDIPVANVTYTVFGSDSIGCSAQASDTITLKYGPNKPTITRQGNVLTSSATQSNQWTLNGPDIQGAINRMYTVTQVGCYSVIASNIVNGCSTTSDTMCISTLSGINQLSAISNQLSIYPNPFNNQIFIKINSSAEDVKDWTMQLTDVLGRTLYSMPSLNYNNEIDLSNLSGGVYFITVINKTGRTAVPVVKQN